MRKWAFFLRGWRLQLVTYRSRSEAHDVVAAVDVERFAGDGAGQIAGEKERRAAHFELVHITMQRGAIGMGLHHFAEIAHAPRSQGLDRSEEHTSELQSLRHLVC